MTTPKQPKVTHNYCRQCNRLVRVTAKGLAADHKAPGRSLWTGTCRGSGQPVRVR